MSKKTRRTTAAPRHARRDRREKIAARSEPAPDTAQHLRRHATHARQDLDELRRWAREGCDILGRVAGWIDGVAPTELRWLEWIARSPSEAGVRTIDGEPYPGLAAREDLYRRLGVEDAADQIASARSDIRRTEQVVAELRDPIVLHRLASLLERVRGPVTELSEVLPRASEASETDAVDEVLRGDGWSRGQIAAELGTTIAALDKRRTRRTRRK